MSPAAAERAVALTMRGLALTFAVVGILFIASPDGVIGRLDDVGNWLGSFPDGPPTEEKFWLALGFAYMTVITGLAIVISTDVMRFDREVFIYLANFVMDASLVGVALGCWALLGRVEEEARAPV